MTLIVPRTQIRVRSLLHTKIIFFVKRVHKKYVKRLMTLFSFWGQENNDANFVSLATLTKDQQILVDSPATILPVKWKFGKSSHYTHISLSFWSNSWAKMGFIFHSLFSISLCKLATFFGNIDLKFDTICACLPFSCLTSNTCNYSVLI